MPGTIVCGVVESPAGLAAAELAGALSERLDLRLVLVHVLEGLPPGRATGPAGETMRAAERSLGRVAAGPLGRGGAEVRILVGERAEALAQVAAEEGADLIVVGARPAGVRRGALRCGLARELGAATTVPVLLAPPHARPRSERRLVAAPAS
ncbi:MAG: universal stress protein [Thermoleophilia bacterium]|nr:universal stress protein [Thermoleophilia bacterium]